MTKGPAVQQVVLNDTDKVFFFASTQVQRAFHISGGEATVAGCCVSCPGKYQLSCSNCEDWTTKDVLERASTEHLKLWVPLLHVGRPQFWRGHECHDGIAFVWSHCVTTVHFSNSWSCSLAQDNASLGYTEPLGNPLLLQEIWNRYRPAVEREHQRQGSGGSLPHDVNEQKAVNITACATGQKVGYLPGTA